MGPFGAWCLVLILICANGEVEDGSCTGDSCGASDAHALLQRALGVIDALDAASEEAAEAQGYDDDDDDGSPGDGDTNAEKSKVKTTPHKIDNNVAKVPEEVALVDEESEGRRRLGVGHAALTQARAEEIVHGLTGAKSMAAIAPVATPGFCYTVKASPLLEGSPDLEAGDTTACGADFDAMMKDYEAEEGHETEAGKIVVDGNNIKWTVCNYGPELLHGPVAWHQTATVVEVGGVFKASAVTGTPGTSVLCNAAAVNPLPA